MKAKFIYEAFNVLKGPDEEIVKKTFFTGDYDKYKNIPLKELEDNIEAYESIVKTFRYSRSDDYDDGLSAIFSHDLELNETLIKGNRLWFSFIKWEEGVENYDQFVWMLDLKLRRLFYVGKKDGSLEYISNHWNLKDRGEPEDDPYIPVRSLEGWYNRLKEIL